MWSDNTPNTPRSWQQAGDWNCPNPECKNHYAMVFGKKSSCPECGAEKPINAQFDPTTARHYQQPGDWHCPDPQCKNHKALVFAKNSVCPECGAAKTSGSVAVPSAPRRWKQVGPTLMAPVYDNAEWLPPWSKPGDWACPNASCKNSTTMVFAKNDWCPSCGAPRPNAGPSKAEQRSNIMLAAKLCEQYPNADPAMIQYFLGASDVSGSSSRMGATYTSKGGGKSGQGLQDEWAPPWTRPGDWKCPNTDCKNHRTWVFAKNETCPTCAAPKPHNKFEGKPWAREGDWQCPNPECKNHETMVFASKPSCPSCGSARPETSRVSPY